MIGGIKEINGWIADGRLMERKEKSNNHRHKHIYI